MTDIDITDTDLRLVGGKVVIVTGGSSGIGLATTQLLLSFGAKVMVGDVKPCPLSPTPALTHQYVDVRDWKSQLAFFKKTIEAYGKIDHVFANAGLAGVATYLEDNVDSNGDLLPPDGRTLDVNLTGAIYTCKLGICYLKHYGGDGCSIIITASPGGYMPFSLTDYNVSKHAVTGLMRGLSTNLSHTKSPIRINAIAPLWAATGMVPADKMKALGINTQSAQAVARSAALCMADSSRHGHIVFSVRGQYREVGQALLKAAVVAMGTEPGDNPQDVETARKMGDMLMKHAGL